MKLEKKEMNPEIVSEAEWLVARKDLLTREKEFTRQRDALSAARRKLPMVKIDKKSVFEGPDGKKTLADLFEGRSQLIVYHFMFGPGWEEGCKSCSYLADHFDGANWHLPHRDVTFVVISRAPLSEFEPYKKRMGWRFKWLSSFGSDFNHDFNVSCTPQELASGRVYYNYRMNEGMGAGMEEMHGLSVFSQDGQGNIFHTYSSYGRGVDLLVGAYNYMDLTPRGRDEAGLPFTMSWVRHHDRYEPAPASSIQAAPACCHADASFA
jgi:predicted dithiol-disulfide oxidoreductase (DUF899 family)